MAEILLSDGGVVLLDDEDVELVTHLKWHRSPRKQTSYAYAHDRDENYNRIGVYMHRIILGAPKGVVVDHINHNGLDNRRANIRLCTQQENTWNRRPLNGGLASKGVLRDVQPKHALNPYRAYIKKDGYMRHLGVFATEREAAEAYDAAAIELFGEFAHTNAKASA